MLPDADHVPGGVAEGRYPQIALRIRRRHNLPTSSNNLLQRLIDPLNEDIRPDTRLSGNRHVDHEVSDHVAGSIREAGIVAICVHPPAEHALVEDG